MNLMVITSQKSIIDTFIKQKRNPNITLKIVIKSQEKRVKEETSKERKTNNNKERRNYKNNSRKSI